jgi:hypothetical protein
MDELLASLYGTAEVEVPQAGVEKLAKLAEEEGVDLSEFSEEELQALVQELETAEAGNPETAAPGAAPVGDPPGEPTAEQLAEAEEQEALQKIADMDTAGRIMAHAMVQELRNIEKVATDPRGWDVNLANIKRSGESAGDKIRAAAEKAKGGLRRAGGALAGTHGRAFRGQGLKEKLKMLAYGGGAGSGKGKILATTLGRAGLAGAAALPFVGRGKEAGIREKLAELQFERAAEARALEILQANGYQVQ